MKTYDIWYEFSNGSIYTDIPFRKAKRHFAKLIRSCTKKSDILDFRFFRIKEKDNDAFATFIPSQGTMSDIQNIKNQTSRNAIEKMFKSGKSYLDNLKNSDFIS